MQIFLKGLTNKTILKKSIVIVLIIQISIVILYSINAYYSKKEYENTNSLDKRTLTFEIEDVADVDLSKEKNIIEYSTIDDEYTAIFNTRKSLEEFISKYQGKISYTDLKVSTVDDFTHNISILLKFLIILITIILFGLFVVFNLNYLISIKENISLYVILGYKKKKVLYLILLVLTLIYLLLETIIIIICSLIFSYYNYNLLLYIMYILTILSNLICFIMSYKMIDTNYLKNINNSN